jgi:hypothetical protein
MRGSSGSLFAPLVSTQPAWKDRVVAALQHPVATLLSVLVTLWALLGDDIRILTVKAPNDRFFLPATIICICYFTLETGASRNFHHSDPLAHSFYSDMLPRRYSAAFACARKVLSQLLLLAGCAEHAVALL